MENSCENNSALVSHLFDDEAYKVVKFVSENMDTLLNLQLAVGDIRGMIQDALDGYTTSDELAAAVAAIQASMGETFESYSTELGEFSTRTTALETSFADLDSFARSTIIDQIQSASTATEAVASSVTALETQFSTDLSDAIASVREDFQSTTDATSANASAISALDAAYKTADATTRASVTNEANTRATEDTALATQISLLRTDMETADSVVSAQVSTEATARANADSAITQMVTELAAVVDTKDAATNARIESEQTARADADSANAAISTQLQARMTTLEDDVAVMDYSATIDRLDQAIVDGDAAVTSSLTSMISSIEVGASGGNLFTNTDFADGSYTGWVFYKSNPSIVTPNVGVDFSGPDWTIPNVVGFEVQQTGSIGNTNEYTCILQDVAVKANEPYQVYAFVAAHRAKVSIVVECYSSTGTALTSYTTGPLTVSTGGNLLSSREQIGIKVFTPPVGTSYVRVYIRKADTNSGETDSYMWVVHPFIGETTPSQDSWIPYSAGNNGAVINKVVASVTSEANTRASSDTSLSNLISSLTATVGANTTAISNESSARSSADTALGTQISNLTTAVNGNSSSIISLNTALTNLDSSTGSSISTLTSNYNSLSSTVTNNYNTLSNSLSTQASSISTLTSNYNGLSSTVTTQASTLSDLMGRTTARWSVTAVSGSNIASLQLVADAGYAGFDITGNVTISGNLLVNGTINSTKLVTDAVTKFQQAYNSTGYSGANYTESGYDINGDPIYTYDYHDVISYNVVMEYAGDIITLLAAKQNYSSGLRSWSAQLVINDTVVFSTSGSGGYADSIAMSGKLSVSAGTYAVKFRWQSSDSSLSISTGGASLVALRRYA